MNTISRLFPHITLYKGQDAKKEESWKRSAAVPLAREISPDESQDAAERTVLPFFQPV